MSGYFISCETLPFVDANGVVYCTAPIVRETPPSLFDLSVADVNSLSSAVLFLFASAYLLRMVRQFIESKMPGRN